VRTFLIDGYNLLHAVGFAGPGRWEKRRLKLLDWIADAAPVRAGTARVRVVFDAQHGTGDDRERPHRSVLVRFAVRQTADDLIETLLASESAPSTVAVVSNDGRVREAARRRGAAGWSCEAFTDWLVTGSPGPGASPAPPADPPPEKPDGPAPAEVEALLAAFGQTKAGSPRRRP
jgi:predicted RNA-binding protein with PIN domain